MQESTTQERSPDARGGPLSPGKAFVIALLLLAAALTGWMLSRPDAPTPPPTTNNEPTEPNYTLTNEEAIARFRDLRALLIEAYRSRDTSLLNLFLVPDAKNASRIRSEIERLREEQVVDKTRLQRLSIQVVSSSAQSIELRERFIVYPRFEDQQTGKSVTIGRPQRQVALWTLRPHEGEWKLFNAIIIRSVPVSRNPRNK